MRSTFLLVISFVGTFAAGFDTAFAEDEKTPPKITYDDHVKPILQQKCFSCHNPDKKSADLDLTTYTNLMLGGASGTVIEPGDASASYLFELVTHESEPVMPPESPKIPDGMIETLRKWIDDGVLENSGSTAKTGQTKKFDLGLAAPSTERPEVIPMPARMSLQPALSPVTRTATDALATSPWAPLAAISGQHQVLLYRTDNLELVGVLPFPEGNPRVLKFSRNGSLLLAGGGVAGASGRVVVWDVRSGEQIIEVGDELDEVLAADISSDQTLIALAGPQRVVRIYATDTGRLMHEIRKHTDWITTLEFSPDSVLLATGDRNGGLLVWEAWTGREYLTLNGHTAAVTSVSWRSDSNIVASASEDSTIRLWEMENGGQVKNWGAHGGGTTCVEFTRDGRLFSSGRDRVAKLWDQNGGQLVAYEAFGDLALQATFCDETNRAIAGDWNGEIRVWNAVDGIRLGELLMNPPTLERRLATAGERLTSIQQAHAPIAASHQLAQTSLEKMRVSIATAQKNSTELKQKADLLAASLATSQQAAVEASAQRTARQQQVDELAGALPLLRDAAAKAGAASSRLPTDQALASASQAIQSIATGKASQLETARQSLDQATQTAEKAAMEIGSLEALAADATTALVAAQKVEQDLLAQLPAVEQGATAAEQAFNQSNAELAAAQQSVARWTEEIEFTKRLDELTSQRTQSLASLSEQETKLAELVAVSESTASSLRDAQQRVSASKGSLANAEKDYGAAVSALEAAKQAQTATSVAKDDTTASVARLEQVIAKLTEANQKMEQAIALAKEDPSLQGAIVSLNDVAKQKRAEWESTKIELAAKDAAFETAIAQVKAADQAVATLLAKQASLKHEIATHTADASRLEQEHQDAQTKAEAFTTEVKQTQAGLDAIQAAITTAKST